jgi:hypothetical protein
MPAVLDTHAAIWYLFDTKNLSQAVFSLIDTAAGGWPSLWLQIEPVGWTDFSGAKSSGLRGWGFCSLSFSEFFVNRSFVEEEE